MTCRPRAIARWSFTLAAPAILSLLLATSTLYAVIKPHDAYFIQARRGCLELGESLETWIGADASVSHERGIDLWFDYEIPPLGPITWLLRIPLWAPLLLTAVPAVFLWRQHLRARRNPHACPACRYDRRGLTPAAPCPECGTAPSRIP